MNSKFIQIDSSTFVSVLHMLDPRGGGLVEVRRKWKSGMMRSEVTGYSSVLRTVLASFMFSSTGEKHKVTGALPGHTAVIKHSIIHSLE